MINPEVGLCEIGEYTAGEEHRVMEEDLSIDALYTFMVALKKPQRGYSAAKYPARILDAKEQDSGLYLVEFVVDNSFWKASDTKLKGEFENGYLIGESAARTRVKVPPRFSMWPRRSSAIREGYFKGSVQDGKEEAERPEYVEEGLRKLLEYAREQEAQKVGV